MIKVFFDSQPLKTGHFIRGIGSYTRNLLEALRKNKDIKLVQNKAEADVVHYPYFDLFFDTLKLTNKPTVVTIYDVIPLIYPKHYPSGIRGRLRFFLQKNRLKNVNAVITISETSKKDILRFLDIPEEKIYPIYLAPGSSFRKLATGNCPPRFAWQGRGQLETMKRYTLPKYFVLYVGDVNYNKNIEGLLRAFALLLANKSTLKQIKTNKSLGLALVGKGFKDDIPEVRRILHLIKELNLEDFVIMPGFIPDDELVEIYNLATVYCQPSFYEGFGLPVLEAMACGTPVAASRTQALVEIAENAALFFNPHDPKDTASVLESVVVKSNLQKRLSEKGQLDVQNFSWEKTARETINVYKKVVN